MTTPIVYQSSDTSAPALTGQVGSLIGVLDACLVNGYGSKAAAGWTKAFSATNKASYRQAAGNSFYLDVDDNATGGGGAKEAGVRGYETMTAVGTGTNEWPTTSDVSANNETMRKSATADATARAWILIADDRTFYMWVLTGDTTGAYMGWGYGDFYSYISGDPGRTMIIARNAANSNLDTMDDAVGSWGQSGQTQNVGKYMARASSGAAGSKGFEQWGFVYKQVGESNHAVISAPDGISGYIFTSRRMIAIPGDTSNGIRGYLRGLYYIVQGNGGGAPNPGDTYSGLTGTGLAGRNFLVIGVGRGMGYYAVVETTAWDTSS